MGDEMRLIPSIQVPPRLRAEADSEIPDGIFTVQAPTLWSQGFKGQGMVVAVIDTGCYPHVDLAGRIIAGKNFTTEGTETDYSDNHGHGTHVAGTIAAIQNGSGVVGVAPEASLLILKVLTKDGRGDYTWTRQAIEYAITWRGPNGEKVDVISMSLGGPTDDVFVHASVKKAVGVGILVVCAGGNDGDGNPTTNEFAYPGAYDEVVSVGAYDGYGKVADFSNSNVEIDLVAPGYYIKSTYKDGGYVYLSGTSMAAPHVSGSAVLIKQQCKAVLHWDLTEAELFKQLVGRSYPLEGVAKTSQGAGLLQMGVRIVPRSYLDIDFNKALEIASMFRNINGESDPILDTPQFWINMMNKYAQGQLTNADFRYVDIAFRKFAAALR